MALVLATWLPSCVRRSPPADEVVLAPGSPEVLIGPAARTYVDVGSHAGRADVERAMSQGTAVSFTTAQPNLGYVRGDLWLRFRVRAEGAAPSRWVLEVGREWTELAELWLEDGHGGYRVARTGTALRFSERALPSERPLLPLEVPAGESRECWLRIRSAGPLALVGALRPEAASARLESDELLFMGGYYAALLAMALYHAFLFASLRERSYGWLSLIALGSFAIEISFHGTLMRFVEFATDASFCGVLLGLTPFTISGFTRSFLDTRRVAPRMHRVLVGTSLAVLAGATAWLFGRYAILVAFAAAAPTVPAPLVASLQRARAGFRPAWYAALALAAYLFPVTPTVLFYLGLFPTSPVEAVGHVGMISMLILSSLGIAARIREERRDASSALAEQHRAVLTLNEQLRRQVAERSRQLAEVLTHVQGGGAVHSPGALATGTLVAGRYRVVRQLGAGGMGAVYEVERLGDGASFALKVLTQAAEARQLARLAREAQVAATVSHPNLVSVVDVDITPEGTFFIVMDLVRGSTLAACEARFGDAVWALPILRQVAAGLAALHAAGVVHRDLKPENVLLAGGSESPTAKISDFGISRLVDSGESAASTAVAAVTPRPAADPTGRTVDAGDATLDAAVTPPAPTPRRALTHAGALLGTPAYMAPELATGAESAGTAADVWSFGVLAWELLCGAHPFEVPPVMLAAVKLAIPTPEPPERVPASLRAVLRACLATEPAARPDAPALARMLAEVR